MCYDEGRLMAYLDGEVSGEERESCAAHLAECGECRARLAELEAGRDFAARRLGQLQPAAKVVPMPASSASPAARAGRKVRWSQVAAIAAAVLLLGSFGFSPVRSAAASLLQVFRVQEVKTIDLSESDMRDIQGSLQSSGHVNLKAYGEAWIEGATDGFSDVTLAQAQAAVDFPIVLPSNQATAPAITLQKVQSYKFKLHVNAINKALASYGSDQALPSSLEGKVFAINVPPVVVASYPSGEPVEGKPAPREIFVGQARSPELVLPEGVDPAQLREVLLNLPFIPSNVRSQLASIQNWTSTLPIPNVNGSSHNVTINGVSAVVMSPRDATRDARSRLSGLPPASDSATVVWNDHGVVRAIGGDITEDEAINLAKSMVR